LKQDNSLIVYSLLTRVEVWQPIDTLANPQLHNPYRGTERDHANYGKFLLDPTADEARIWCSSFKDLLNDPRGAKMFMKYLEGEFSSENLKFYLKCQELDCELSREDWNVKAKKIYTQFVAPNAQNEINIDAQIRQNIVNKFSALENLEKSKPNKVHDLDIYVFTEALNRVQTLMNKDSYQRFCQSDAIKKVLHPPVSETDFKK
jgi:regulator of G-protein signaling